MNIGSRALLGTSVLLALSACGGGGSNSSPSTPAPITPAPTPPSVQTGVLGQTPLIGVSYSTASQSGQTNENGHFTYLENETVSFSVGGVVIGESIGADQITLQDIHIDSLPTHVNDFMKLNRDTRIDDFDRFVNVLTFVYSLDNDGVIENGIDLREMQNMLAAASVNFDTKSTLFAQNDFPALRFKYGIEHDLRFEALAYVYQAQNIMVTESVELTRQQQGLIGRPNTSQTIEYELDDQGRWTESVRISDANSDQVSVSALTNKRTFNDAGNETRRESIYDDDNNGVVDRIFLQTREYDDNNNLLSITNADDQNNDGAVDSLQIFRYEYNNNGLRTAFSIDVDAENDGILNSTRTTMIEYDDAGQPTANVMRIDNNADGIVDYISSSSNVFNEQGLQVQSSSSYDNDGDGISDACSTVNFEFNELGQEVQTVSESDRFCDEQIESVRTTQSQYSDAGDETMWVETEDSNNNGEIDSQGTSEWTYDQQRNVLSQTNLFDRGVDGIEVRFSRTLYQYNNEGLLQQKTFERGEDQIVEFTDVEHYTYDENNNLIELIEESTRSAQEAPHRIQITRSTFDEFGNELTTTFTSDDNNDGVIDQTRTMTKTYRHFEKTLSAELADMSF